MEPIPIPKEVSEYYYFVYQRTEVSNPLKKFEERKMKDASLNALCLNHYEDLIQYNKKYTIWEETRNVSENFINLESLMNKLLPTVALENIEKTPLSKIRSRSHIVKSLPKFICNQFLFGDEPVKPPESFIEYFCYYERDWDTSQYFEPFDGKNSEIWIDVQKHHTRHSKEIQSNNYETLKANFDEAHETWYRNLSYDMQKRFQEYAELRKEIKKLCQ